MLLKAGHMYLPMRLLTTLDTPSTSRAKSESCVWPPLESSIVHTRTRREQLENETTDSKDSVMARRHNLATGILSLGTWFREKRYHDDYARSDDFYVRSQHLIYGTRR